MEFYCYTAPQRFSCCFHLDSAAVNFQTVANFRWETRTYFIARGRLRDWTGTFSVESVTIFLSLFSCSRTVCDSLARMACQWHMSGCSDHETYPLNFVPVLFCNCRTFSFPQSIALLRTWDLGTTLLAGAGEFTASLSCRKRRLFNRGPCSKARE